MTKLPPRIDSTMSSNRVRPTSDEQARRDGGQLWLKSNPPKLPLQQVTQKRPTQGAQKKSALSKVGKVYTADSLEPLAPIEGIDATPFDAGDQTDYTPPAIRRSIERAYSPAEGDTFDFCRPTIGDSEKAARKIFDDPAKFTQITQHLPGLLAGQNPALAERLRALLNEEKMALELVQGYKNALVFS